MIKIVKNTNQCKAKALRNCKWLLYTNDFGDNYYAKPGLRPILGYILAKLKRSPRLE